MLAKLELEILRHKIIRAKTTMMCRIVHFLVAIELPPQISQTGSASSGHQHRYRIHSAAPPLIKIQIPSYIKSAARRSHHRQVPGVIQDQYPGI